MQIAQIGAAFRKSFLGQGDGITAQKLLELATIDAARVIGMERQIGSLEAGKKADATILNMKQPHLVPSLDPVADIVYFGKGSDVETVIIDGKVVVDNRQVKTVNEQEILSYAQGAGERAWARFYGK
jgi:5-methylthioadenosine/S-adenosylhomocysteine deaminase